MWKIRWLLALDVVMSLWTWTFFVIRAFEGKPGWCFLSGLCFVFWIGQLNKHMKQYRSRNAFDRILLTFLGKKDTIQKSKERGA